MGRSDTGISGDAGEVRIYPQLRWVQKNRCQAKGREGEQEAEATKEQTIPAGGISGAEGAGGCEVRAQRVRRRRAEVLPVHRCGRVYPLDLPANVR